MIDIEPSSDVSGPDSTLQAQALRPGLKVVLITGHVDEAEAARSVVIADLEASPKPFQVASPIERVGRMLGDDGTR